MKDLKKSFLIPTLIVVLILPAIVVGQVRESTNYKIERDSLNVGGGLGESTNYKIQDTAGEVGTGISNSSNYQVRAGYQQSLEPSYISISSPSDINMNSINGLIGGYSTSSAQWTVTTNNNSGYSLSIKSSTNPSLKSSLDSFDDYTKNTSNPDYDFSISSDKAEFGFSPSGSHILTKFKDNGSVCNVNDVDTAFKCWDGLTTSDSNVAQSNSSNDPSGTITTIYFRAESGSDRILTAGDYSATITMTALAL